MMTQQTASTEMIHVVDWVAQAQDRLLVRWDKPRIRAFIAALATAAQVQEDLTWDVLVSTGIDEATGDALDQWGELVGEQRLGLNDQEYRGFIKARMLVNRTASTVDELLEILDVATKPNASVRYEENLPAGFYLQVVRSTFMTEATRRRVARLMLDARPGGRHMTVIESLVGSFGFDGDDDAEGYDVGAYSRLITSPLS